MESLRSQIAEVEAAVLPVPKGSWLADAADAAGATTMTATSSGSRSSNPVDLLRSVLLSHHDAITRVAGGPVARLEEEMDDLRDRFRRLWHVRAAGPVGSGGTGGVGGGGVSGAADRWRAGRVKDPFEEDEQARRLEERRRAFRATENDLNKTTLMKNE